MYSGCGKFTMCGKFTFCESLVFSYFLTVFRYLKLLLLFVSLIIQVLRRLQIFKKIVKFVFNLNLYMFLKTLSIIYKSCMVHNAYGYIGELLGQNEPLQAPSAGAIVSFKNQALAPMRTHLF